MKYIDSDKIAKSLRNKLVELNAKKVLIANLTETEEEKDNYTKVNCDGFGRVRSFSKYSLHLRNSQKGKNEQTKPLLRGCANCKTLLAQAFQIAGCNWNCWYCFVDMSRRTAQVKNGEYLSSDELIDMFLTVEKINVLDLTGGQPDLVPEWILWTMEELDKRNLRDKIFLWSDDNLSTDYFWRYLTRKQIEYIKMFPKYSRTGCFKGYDESSFSFNTGAKPELFQRQFDLFQRLVREGIDMYAYATFTNQDDIYLDRNIKLFVDKLQQIHHNLPLRTIPLKIVSFSTVCASNHDCGKTIAFQFEVYNAWKNELCSRFSAKEIEMPYEKVSLS
ncbi:MAG: 4Fe-4S cluster-binding domain-containing protein [Patescibacteria group bacterium]|jgi:uncharacterized Fe-S cluster-containing radical SAM superfamily protein|nr:4Fe-4S cluster-binding domain-containing protein [Patescibacteria group bacterium]